MMVSFLAVLVAAILGMIVRALWYSPLFFGTLWMHLMGFGKKQCEAAKKKGLGKTYALAFLVVVVMSTVLAYLIQITALNSVAGAVALAATLWLGFIATSFLNSILWEGKSFKLYLLNIAQYLVVLMVMALVLQIWPW